MANVRDLIREAVELDHEVTRLDGELDDAKEKAARAWLAVHQQMEDDGYKPGDDIRVDGTRYGYQIDWYAQIQDAREFTEYAEREAPHLIQPQPRKALLNQLVEQAHEDGQVFDIPGVGEWPKRWVSKRAAGAK
jgi:hypothetical protein